jgi:hypothetical protein
MARANGAPTGSHSAGSGAGRRLPANQVRILDVLARVPAVRDQLFAAVEAIPAPFGPQAVEAAQNSANADERNRVSALERNVEILINWTEELASRALSEGQRLAVISANPDGPPWERLAALGVLPQATARRWYDARYVRNRLSHGYPLDSWEPLCEAVSILLNEHDNYLVPLYEWATATGILPPAT